MTSPRRLKVLLVDPSLFTAPYDAALTGGLIGAGVEPHWVVRPLRRDERAEIPPARAEGMFYRRVDDAMRLPARLRAPAKGLAHLWGLLRLTARVAWRRPDIVHVQWAVLPVADAFAMRVMRLFAPVVMTVHDTVPFNGETISRWQNAGYDLPLRVADRLIVHTERGKAELVARGLDGQRISVIPHGAMRPALPVAPRRPLAQEPYRFVLFGQLKPYKGADLLIDAVARLEPAQRARARWTVAGRAYMDLAPLRARIAQLGLDGVVEIREGRLSDEAMAALFGEADCFVYPYRQIDASGVWYLTKPLGRWMIASAIGVFADEMPSASGVLVPAGDVGALARALSDAVEARPSGVAYTPDDEWAAIGAATRRVYDEAARGHRPNGARVPR